MVSFARAAGKTQPAGRRVGHPPVGRRGNPLNMGPDDESLPPSNSSVTIGGRLYTGHALDGMQSGGIPPAVVEDVIGEGARSPGKTPGTMVHSGGGVVVVTNQSGDVVTVHYGPR